MQHFNTPHRMHLLATKLQSVPQSTDLALAAGDLLHRAAALELAGANVKARRYLKRAAKLVFRAHREAVKAESILRCA